VIRDRILEAIGIQTEPEIVDRASRRERWKRQAWMFTSTLLSFGFVTVRPWWFQPVSGIISLGMVGAPLYRRYKDRFRVGLHG